MELPERILKELDASKDSNLESLSLAEKFNLDHQKIVGAIKSLESLGQVINSESYVIRNKPRCLINSSGSKTSILIIPD